MTSELAALEGGVEINFADKYITLIYPERACLLDYFSSRTTVLLRGTAAIADRLKASEWHLNQTERVRNSFLTAFHFVDFGRGV